MGKPRLPSSEEMLDREMRLRGADITLCSQATLSSAGEPALRVLLYQQRRDVGDGRVQVTLRYAVTSIAHEGAAGGIVKVEIEDPTDA